MPQAAQRPISMVLSKSHVGQTRAESIRQRSMRFAWLCRTTSVPKQDSLIGVQPERRCLIACVLARGHSMCQRETQRHKLTATPSQEAFSPISISAVGQRGMAMRFRAKRLKDFRSFLTSAMLDQQPLLLRRISATLLLARRRSAHNSDLAFPHMHRVERSLCTRRQVECTARVRAMCFFHTR